VPQSTVTKTDLFVDAIIQNAVFYIETQANYAFITAIFFLYLCYSLPLFVLIVPGTVVGYSLLVARTRPFAIANHTLLKAHALLAFVTFCALVSLIFGGFAFVGTLVMSALVVVAHAALRQRPTNSKALNFIDLWNGVSPAPGSKSFEDEESVRCPRKNRLIG
jgi:hypothetical protein